MIGKESYRTPVNLKPLNKHKYSQELIDTAYDMYVKDFHEKGWKGQHLTLYGFEHFAFNRDLFIHEAIIKSRDKKINKILNGDK